MLRPISARSPESIESAPRPYRGALASEPRGFFRAAVSAARAPQRKPNSAHDRAPNKKTPSTIDPGLTNRANHRGPHMTPHFYIRLAELALTLLLAATILLAWREARADRAQLQTQLAAANQALAAATDRQQDRDAKLNDVLANIAA